MTQAASRSAARRAARTPSSAARVTAVEPRPSTSPANLVPGPLGLPFAALARLAFGPADREARDGHRLAPQGISALLDVEEPYGPRPSSRAQ
jgi:hypothetical protein